MHPFILLNYLSYTRIERGSICFYLMSSKTRSCLISELGERGIVKVTRICVEMVDEIEDGVVHFVFLKRGIG